MIKMCMREVGIKLEKLRKQLKLMNSSIGAVEIVSGACFVGCVVIAVLWGEWVGG